MNNLILVRHGQSLWNKERRFTGWADIDLTEQGKSEAKEAGKLIKIELEKPENIAKMNERLGEWAGSKLGKSEEEKKNYIQEIIKSDLEEAGQEDVFRKIKKDFQAASIDIEETEIRDQMEKALLRAKEDFKK